MGRAITKRETERSLPGVDLTFVVDPDNADEALLLLGLVTEVEVFGDLDLQLEPWAVQAAFSLRRVGRRLTERDMFEIRRSTRAPERLRWPTAYRIDGE